VVAASAACVPLHAVASLANWVPAAVVSLTVKHVPASDKVAPYQVLASTAFTETFLGPMERPLASL